MRNRVIGGIGIVWGSGVVLYGRLGQERGGGADGAGQIAGIVIGAVILIAGLSFLLKGVPPAQKKPAKGHRGSGRAREGERPGRELGQVRRGDGSC
jgi:hypothetical protein